MTTRERFNAVMHWEKPDRIPNMEFGYWTETFTIWHEQGLPGHIRSHEAMEDYLGLEGSAILPRVPVAVGAFPELEETVLEEHDGRQIILDKDGNTCERFRDTSSMPKFIKYGLETRDDWEKLKEERLNAEMDGRIGDIQAMIREADEAGMPVRLDAGSLYGWLRNWMGLENISIALMTEKDWVEEMMEHLTRLFITMIERALYGVHVDVAWWWEDMAFNQGPLMSPKLFHELMVPRYREITATLKNTCGADVNLLDCDGRIDELVPGWLEGGINCMFPLESIHTDPFRIREKFEDALLFGGVNKMELIKGKDHIDREVERLYTLVQKGGYIPCVDHRVPPDVTFENYLYYLEKKKDILS